MDKYKVTVFIWHEILCSGLIEVDSVTGESVTVVGFFLTFFF